MFIVHTCVTCMQAGKARNMGKVMQWSGNIINHFWFSCRTCEGNAVKLKVYMYAL